MDDNNGHASSSNKRRKLEDEIRQKVHLRGIAEQALKSIQEASHPLDRRHQKNLNNSVYAWGDDHLGTQAKSERKDKMTNTLECCIEKLGKEITDTEYEISLLPLKAALKNGKVVIEAITNEGYSDAEDSGDEDDDNN